MIAAESARRGAAIIHLSTDYVFDGGLDRPYRPDDATNPQSVYGHTKLAGEQRVREANPRHIIVRTSWVYSAVGRNFVKTMLRLAGEHDVVRVVADQRGCPTYAPHLAEALLAVAARVANEPDTSDIWGTYHATGSGIATWADLAEEVFETSGKLGGPTAKVEQITTSEYPTPATRPANSSLDCTSFVGTFGCALPAWQAGAQDCVNRLVKAK